MPALRKRKLDASVDEPEKPATATAPKKRATKESNGKKETATEDAPRVKRQRKVATKAVEKEEKKTPKKAAPKPSAEKKTEKATPKKETKKAEPKKPAPKEKKAPAPKAEKAVKAKPAKEEKEEKAEKKTQAKKTKVEKPKVKEEEEEKSESAKGGRKRVGPSAPAPVNHAKLVSDSISKHSHARSVKPSFNEIPLATTKRINVYVFGTGSICELGLGPKVTTVKRPRLNPLLPIDTAGITKVTTGGAHALALDHLGRVWSWGQNDCGVLGRYTKENDDEAEDDWYINSKESTPGLVEGLPENAVFVEIGATDNLSAAVTDNGQLWAWGTFIDDGQKSFKTGVEYQLEPLHITLVKQVVKIVGGKDHLLILDKKGNVYAWGIAASHQLGVSVNSNLRSKVFGPLKVPHLKKIKDIFAGEYTSFAIDDDGKVWSWGLNNFGQAGHPEEAGAGATIETPTHAEFFDDKKVVQIASGNHHSLALTADGEIYVFGEMNFYQLGLDPKNLPESTVREKDGTPAYVPVPTKLIGAGIPKFKYVAAGSDHSLALSAEDGSAWTWGFGETFQLGHGNEPGEDPEDEQVPKKIENTASRGVNMVFAGAGGQFSVLTGEPREGEAPAPKTEKKEEVAASNEIKDVEMTNAKEEVKEETKSEENKE